MMAAGKISFDSFFRVSFFLFRLVFVSFTPLHKDASLKEKIRYFVRLNYNKICIVGTVLALASKALLAYNSVDLMKDSQIVLDVIAYFLNATKISQTYYRRNDIWKIIQDLKLIFDRRSEANQIQEYGVKKYLNNYLRLMATYATPSLLMLFGILLTILPYLLYGIMDFGVEYWYPFDPYKVETFPIAYAWVSWTSSYALIFMLGSDSMLFALITVIAMEFNILKIDLANFLKVTDDQKVQELNHLIDHHNKLLDISKKLQQIYSFTFFISFLISSMIMCFLAICIARYENDLLSLVFYLTYFWMMSAQILLLCVFGQKLIDSSETIIDGVYSCGWEEIDNKVLKKQLILIMLRAQKPRNLTAMGFADISLETYTTVCSLMTIKMKILTNKFPFPIYRS